MASPKNREKRRRAEALARRLEGNEKLLERLEAVLDLAESDQDRSLEEIEMLLIGALRQLGSESLGSWVARREEALSQDLREQHEKLNEREKKTSTSTPPSEKSR